MKKLHLAPGALLLLSLPLLPGCQNCDEQVKAAQTACESRITTVRDSINGIWQTRMDSVKGAYEAQITGLQTQIEELQASAQAKTSTPTKKPATTSAPAPKKEETPSKVTKGGQNPTGTSGATEGEQKPKVTKGGQPR
ncbi:MAG: hypothetical protein KatS3mg031_0714 [Chitinophagales bacterium]|nr:MAG: hypothetical protein KatS3mg031_0714 [Chitinophagales bacterium]